jgi:hypothetical protein
MLIDLDNDEKDLRLDDIARISMVFLTEELDDKIRKNILLRLWTGCIEAAKAIGLTMSLESKTVLYLKPQ